jgi:hypothetical protein
MADLDEEPPADAGEYLEDDRWDDEAEEPAAPART